MSHVEIHPSSIAGTWYEGNCDRLAHAVDGYLDATTSLRWMGMYPLSLPLTPDIAIAAPWQVWHDEIWLALVLAIISH